MKAILFYKYTPILDSYGFYEEQINLCKKLGLNGRLLVGREGINGTLSGDEEAIEEYKKKLTEKKMFNDLIFKEDFVKEHVFDKIFVRMRKEVVNFGVNNLDLNKSGEKISPKKFKKLLDEKEDLIILDVRNNYEYEIGRFKKAINLDINNFREFPEKIKELSYLKNKRIITYCTGGIRCEKASSYMKQIGFKEVYQLENGIIGYNNECPNSYFEGKCFVFDKRISVPINTGEHENIISNCIFCNEPCDRYVNCYDTDCNNLFICCENCQLENDRLCNEHSNDVILSTNPC